MQKPIAQNLFAFLWKDSETTYRVTIEDVFKCRFTAKNEAEALDIFFTRLYEE